MVLTVGCCRIVLLLMQTSSGLGPAEVELVFEMISSETHTTSEPVQNEAGIPDDPRNRAQLAGQSINYWFLALEESGHLGS